MLNIIILKALTMKTIFTAKLKGLFIVLCVFLSVTVYSQTKHIVSVTSNKFTPKDLTISAGDTVEWQNNTNVGHNVNGTQSTYPSNPESFGNSIGANWTYSHVFMTTGNYDYRCNPHYALGMVGTITVETVTSSNYNLTENFSRIYPNPAREKVFIEPRGFASSNVRVEIYNIAGKMEYSELLPSERRNEIRIDQLSRGIYFVKLRNNDNEQTVKLIKN